MAGQMSDEQANHEVAAGVLVEQCVPVAVEIPGGETTQGQCQNVLFLIQIVSKNTISNTNSLLKNYPKYKYYLVLFGGN